MVPLNLAADMSPYFTLKLHYGGYLNEDCTAYVGGEIAYFDMCSVTGLDLFEIDAMLGEVGCSSQSMDLWFLTNEHEFCAANINPIETNRDLEVVKTLVECNYKLVRLYTTPNGPGLDGEFADFSFTQLAIDQRIERIEDIRVEVEAAVRDEGLETVQEEEEKLSFHGDSSNMDSSDTHLPKSKKKKRRIPPPNPPYRARKRGRYSMLRGLFKNTEETPVVLDDAGNDVTPEPLKAKKGRKVGEKQNKGHEKEVGEKISKRSEVDGVEKPGKRHEMEGGENSSKREKQKKSVGRLKKGTPTKIIEEKGGDKQGAKLPCVKEKVQEESARVAAVEPKEVRNNVKNKGKYFSQKKDKAKSVKDKDEDEIETVLPEEQGQESVIDEKHVKEDEKNEEMEEDSTSSESEYNSSVERMAISSCDEEDNTFPEFNEQNDMEDPQFEMGMLFSSGQVFREAVRKHAILHQRGVRLKKNLSDKIKWVCTAGCDWKVYGIKQQRSTIIQIKTVCNIHTCTPTWVQKQINSTWLARTYEEEIRMNPSWPLQAFHAKVVNDLKCNISLTMAYRAMRKARETITGRHEEEFSKLYLYANEVKKVMPTSTVKLMTEPAENGFPGRRFLRFYVCLGPLKDGFLEGCRPLIGLDGCHLKGPFGGILLTAVATDPNEGMYPVAWAHVEAENNSSWDWFLGLLKNDLRIENTGTYTFISDRQKVHF